MEPPTYMATTERGDGLKENDLRGNSIVHDSWWRRTVIKSSIVALLQVSFFSTSPELSNKQRFEFFTRTIPSDHYQVKAMVDIVGRMGWKYISILYEESNYGIKVCPLTLFIPAQAEIFCRLRAHAEKDYWLVLIIRGGWNPLFSAGWHICARRFVWTVGGLPPPGDRRNSMHSTSHL